MTRSFRLCLAATVVSGWGLFAAEPNLADYRSVDQAIAARMAKTMANPAAQAGFLGVHVSATVQGQLTVAEIALDSPAQRAGVQRGDRISALDSQPLKDEDSFYDLLRSKPAGDSVQLLLERQGKPLEVKATLAPPSRPLTVGRRKAQLGVQVATVKDGEGVKIEQVEADSAADRAKLKTGEIILKIDDVAVSAPERLTEYVAGKNPGDTVNLTLLVAEKTVEMKMPLGGERSGGPAGGGRPQGAGGFGMRAWTRPTFRLGIILVEYPDAKHNPIITPKAWEDAMFAKGTYTKKNVTGQDVFGSMYDYYLEQSFGGLKIEGKAFEYVEVGKKKLEYGSGTGANRTALLTEALDKVVARDKDALKGLDGVFFIYAAERPSPNQAPRGSLYWPHRASVSHNGVRWPYFICPEGGQRMMNNSVFCHEFGHMLGLPDLYARPENPGMEGAGVWSAMANQVGNGRPQHFDAWSKERLGWIKPTVIDPTVKQKLILAPVEDSPKECFKVLARPDGSEYFLLENRAKKGYDVSLPAHGLLIWRVVGNRPVLEESHGIEGPAGPRMFLTSVPYPTKANDAFTPFTTPSSRSRLGPGGLPVYITNIQKLLDGRIAFQIGYEYY